MDDRIEIPARRRFLKLAGAGLAAPLGLSIGGVARAATPNTDPIALDPLDADTERKVTPESTPWPEKDRVGFAVVGLGHLSLEQIVPAFSQSKKAKLVALVSGSPDKARQASAHYGIHPDSVYDYAHFDEIHKNPHIDAVYIVLPNSLHAEYTIRAARSGKHVLCEKPMATRSADAQNMIRACEQAKRLLMVAYRIQYEPNHRLIQTWVREQRYGTPRFIESVNTQNIGDPEQWRLKKAMSGGGALPDIGLYCLNTTRWLLGEEPEEVVAQTFSTPGDTRFSEVEETVSFQMRFGSGVLATNVASYGTHEDRRYRVNAPKAWFGMDPAYPYQGLQIERSTAEGNLELRDHPTQAVKNQFALELDHFAECIRSGRRPYTPGEEGLQDQRIMEAIYQSAREGAPVKLPKVTQKDAFRGSEPV